MSTPSLISACSVCGAEESLDALLLRMISDDEACRLINDLIKMSLPLGSEVVRYLRLHTPAKQKLRMATIGKLLAELVPDVQRTAIERKGRIWVVSPESWAAAFRVVFGAVEKGTVTLPLTGNGYLYGVLVNIADRFEAQAEEQSEQQRKRHREETPARPLDEQIDAGLSPEGVGARLGRSEPAPTPEAAAKAEEIKQQLKDALALKKARQGADAN